jgi:hypothetical protein
MKKVYNYADSYQRAMNAVLPERTDSYTPIHHSTFISELNDELSNNGFRVGNNRVYTNEDGRKLIGFVDVHNANTPINEERDVNMMIGYRNSYDKSMTIGLASGASVIICGNGVIMGDSLVFVRKHTGRVDQLLRDKIKEVVQGLESSFGRTNIEINIMKDFSLTRVQKAELLGRMYFDEELLTPTQLTVVKNELNESEHFRGNTLWDLYNNVTEALKSSPPMRHISDHVHLHTFMAQVAGIVPRPVPIVVAMPALEPEVTVAEEMDENIVEAAQIEAEVRDFTADEIREMLASQGFRIIDQPVQSEVVAEHEVVISRDDLIEAAIETTEAQDAIPTEEERGGAAIDAVFNPEGDAQI